MKLLANETQASYTYDDAGRVTLLGNLKSTGEVISSFEYEYDEAGNRTSVVEADGDRVTWTYDATYQLLAEHRDGVDAYGHTFTYDPVGNRLTKVEDGSTTSYTYDDANRLRVAEDPVGELTSYTYDADGNQRSIEEPTGDLTTNTWSFENKLIQVEFPTAEVATYTYALVKRDDTEQRVSKDQDTTFSRFVWDEDRILAELDDIGAAEAEYTLEPAAYGNLISQQRAAENSYYHFDALGSTHDLTDTAEVPTDEYSYYAFGATNTESGTTANPYRFVGEQGYFRDAETDYYNVRQNTYGPETATWLSPDQQSQPGRSVYEYAGNNPTNIVDPSGLFFGFLADLFGGKRERGNLRRVIETRSRLIEELAKPDHAGPTPGPAAEARRRQAWREYNEAAERAAQAAAGRPAGPSGRTLGPGQPRREPDEGQHCLPKFAECPKGLDLLKRVLVEKLAFERALFDSVATEKVGPAVGSKK